MDFNKEAKKIERLEKLTLIKSLITLTGKYCEFKLFEETLYITLTEGEAEKLKSFIKDFTGSDISISDLLNDSQDEKNNNLIESYVSFKTELNNMVNILGIEKEKLIKIVEKLHDETYIVNPTIWLFYPEIISNIQLYILNRISKKEMIERFVTTDLRGNYRPISFAFFRRTLVVVLEAYNEIMRENG